MDPSFHDRWPDAELRRVTPPSGLIARLQAIPAADDEGLDALLRETPVPAGLIGRLKQIPFRAAPRERRRSRFERQAVAASLVFTVWFSYAAALVIFWIDYRPQLQTATNWLETDSPLDPEQPPAEQYEALVLGADDASQEEPVVQWSPAPPQMAAAEEQPTLPENAGEMLAMSFTRFPADVTDLLAASTAAAPASVAAAPSGPHFDRAFLSRTGVFPRVDPQHHSISRPGLSTETASFELARECLERGRFPPPDQIRVEDFLAAIDYGLPQPQQADLTLSAAAGRTPWQAPNEVGRDARSDRTLCLVQITVQAGKQPGPTGAAQARMTVRFNPRAVASYRLCGHEPTRLEGAAETVGVDLPAGSCATAVYEIELRDGAHTSDEEVAVATLQWNDPSSGAAYSKRCAIRRGQFAAPGEQAPARLQLASLAVAAGEMLRKSPYAARMSTGAMLELARHGESQGKSIQEFRKFIEIFTHMQAIGQGGADGLARPPSA